MFRKPHLVLVTLLVLAAGSIFLAAQKPGGVKGQTEGEAALLLVVEEAKETAVGKTPSGAQEAEMSAEQIRQALLERAKQHLFKPGWVLVRETLTNYTDREEYTVVPMNGQIIPKNWVRESWLHLDAALDVTAGYSVMKGLDGVPVYESIVSDGSPGAAIQPESLPGWQVEHWQYLYLFDRMIEHDGGKSANFEIIEEDGRRLLRVFTQDVYPSPGFTDGVELAIVSSFGIQYYDWMTGQFLLGEDWANLIDGSQKQINLLEMEIEYPTTPPDEILAQLVGGRKSDEN
ncbi:MAG: hypothetical protein AB1453_03240 [Chloroflexota bacterium]